MLTTTNIELNISSICSYFVESKVKAVLPLTIIIFMLIFYMFLYFKLNDRPY